MLTDRELFSEFTPMDTPLRGNPVSFDLLIAIDHLEVLFSVVARGPAWWCERGDARWHVTCDVLDFGAGNLRLAVPLARLMPADIAAV